MDGEGGAEPEVAMLPFLVIGAVGVVLLLLGLLAANLLDGVTEALSMGEAGGPLSTEVLGAFLSATGFAGALAVNAGAGTAVAAFAGVAAGLPFAWVASRLTRGLAGMPTDATPTTDDLVGAEASVVTPIPATGLGEVVVVQAGQRVKLAASSPAPLSAGERVWITGVLSSTCVAVESTGT
ncbi:MAG: hypothetical protein M3P91_01060 [Actinomycetota bacterium]|nr:hypothetical protein [Actinomycetota bacterium]